jgi:hypothetical protein
MAGPFGRRGAALALTEPGQYDSRKTALNDKEAFFMKARP